MWGENRCPGSGGAPSYLDKGARQKTGQKVYGHDIWVVKCVVCGKPFNVTGKGHSVPEHDYPAGHSARKESGEAAAETSEGTPIVKSQDVV